MISLLVAGFLVVLRTGDHPNTLTVRVAEKAMWQGIPSKWKPWALHAGDIDGNGWPDFAVGVFKQTHLYPDPHRTVFFYEIRNGEVVPKWRGSSLGSPLLDFRYAKTDRGPRLVALQNSLDGETELLVWVWNKFGFRLERRAGRWKSAKFEVSAGELDQFAKIVAHGTPFRVKL